MSSPNETRLYSESPGGESKSESFVKRSLRIQIRQKRNNACLESSGVKDLLANLGKRKLEISRKEEIKRILKTRKTDQNSPEIGKLTRGKSALEIVYSPSILKAKMERLNLRKRGDNSILKRQKLFQRIRELKSRHNRSKGCEQDQLVESRKAQEIGVLEENKENLTNLNLDTVSAFIKNSLNEPSPFIKKADQNDSMNSIDKKEKELQTTHSNKELVLLESEEVEPKKKTSSIVNGRPKRALHVFQKKIHFEKARTAGGIDTDQIDDNLSSTTKSFGPIEKGLDERIKESKVRTYRNNIFIDDCAVSDEEVVDSEDGEYLTLEEERYARELISDNNKETRRQQKRKSKLASQLMIGDAESYILKLQQRFAPDVEASEDDSRVDFTKSLERNITPKEKLKNSGERFDGSEKDTERSEEEGVNYEQIANPKRRRIAMRALMRRAPASNYNLHDNKESQLTLAKIRRVNCSLHADRAKSQGANQPEKATKNFTQFLPQTQPPLSFASQINRLPRKLLKSVLKGENSSLKSKKAIRKKAKRKEVKVEETSYCVFATSNSGENQFERKDAVFEV